MANAEKKIRHAGVSGQFYPSEPPLLKKQIRTFLDQSRFKTDPAVRAIIVPHAGYPYSGQVAAEAYRTVVGRTFESVILIAFLHRVFLQGILVDDVDFYETPLGRIPVDRPKVQKLRQSHPLLNASVRGHLEEHSLEVQLPFLQETVQGLKIVPIYMGMQDLSNAMALADVLAKELKGKNILVVATTDLSHFYPYEVAVEKDKKVIALFEQSHVEEIHKAYSYEEAEACGMGPVLSLLLLAEKMDWGKSELLAYANSGDVTGDRSSVVGYAAMALKEKNAGNG